MALQEKLMQVVEAALHGPAIKDISIKGHGFNVDKVKKEETPDGKVIIKGLEGGDNISHRRFLKDDQVFYGFTVEVGPTGVDITDATATIHEGGFLNTVGAPIMAAFEMWSEIECLWDVLDEESENDLSDCDPIELVSALWDAVTQDSSEPLEIDESARGNVDQLENQRMSWREVAELMILTIASAVVISQISRVRPDWATDQNRIKNAAPDFVGEDFSVQVPKGPGLPGDVKEEAPGGLVADRPNDNRNGLPGGIGIGAEELLKEQDND